MATQLRVVSQTLRDSQQRCHWLEGRLKLQGHAHIQVNPVRPPECLANRDTQTRLILPSFRHQGSVCTEVAPGAPQEKNDDAPAAGNTDVTQLRER